MAIKEFKIGTAEFLGMTPHPQQAQKQLTYLTRSGTDYASVFQDGERGFMQEITTEVDARDEQDIVALVEDYQKLVGGTPLTIKWRGRNFGKYIIHNVFSESFSVLYLSGRVRISFATVPGPVWIVVSRWEVWPVTSVHD